MHLINLSAAKSTLDIGKMPSIADPFTKELGEYILVMVGA
jgi:hypothetical protein